MRFKKLDINDLDRINVLQESLGYNGINDIVGHLFGCFDDTSLIAIVGIFPYNRLPHVDFPSGKVAEVGGLYVKKEYRRQGVATKLLGYALESCKSLCLDAYVIDCKDASYEIFKSYGFEPALSGEHRMWKPL